MSKSHDLTGRRFGNLQVMWLIGRSGTDKRLTWAVACDCGKHSFTTGHNLLQGSTRSCGCLKGAPIRHGHTFVGHRTSEWNAFVNAKMRCTNPNDPRYYCYGARGIRFKFKNFDEFIAHIGVKPKINLTLDRVNNEGHYEIGNVRWATRLENMRNRIDYRKRQG